LLTHRPPNATLIDVYVAREDIVLVTAPELLEELGRVLRYRRLQRYYTEEERTRFVALLLALSELVELPEEIPRICRDPDDDRIVACAVVGGADVIVNGDEDLPALERVEDIPVLSPAELLTRIEKQASEGNGE
jgi:putative PIN family toxin of toxin-antitoxin system